MNNNQKKVLSLSLAVLLGTTSPLVLATRPALAQETQPGDVCSNAGWTRWVSTPTAGLLVCDGANWKSVIALENNGQSLLQVDNDTGSCTADKTGRLRFDGSSTWDYCDGTTWQGLWQVPAACGVMIPPTFPTRAPISSKAARPYPPLWMMTGLGCSSIPTKRPSAAAQSAAVIRHGRKPILVHGLLPGGGIIRLLALML